jgi:mRNA-degrading endonuclease RelE of RelBE toxin-antitoxin system
MNRLEWTRKALKQFISLPGDTQAAIQEALASLLGEWPNARNVKALTNRHDYRLRVGRYRIFFLAASHKEWTEFTIIEVKKRDENTY